MSFLKININKFQGLNSTVAPELIQDGEARDIMNFRMEKVGKLVSRDGNTIGLYLPPYSDAIPISYEEYKNSIIPKSYINNKGIIGIGEFVLSEKWELIDSDRVMVYAIRGDKADSDKYDNKMVFLLSPLTGKHKNKIIISDSIFYADKVDVNPQGYGENTRQLYAPNRKIIGYPNYYKEGEWIKNYIDMNQYRYKLVISDRINGDMILEDEYDRAENIQGKKNQHRLTLKPNCLETFDIDIVEIDYRMGDNEENSITTGVENGMALYGYKLQKRIFRGSSQNTKELYLSDLNYTSGLDPKELSNSKKMASRIRNSIVSRSLKLKFSLINAFPYLQLRNNNIDVTDPSDYKYYNIFIDNNILKETDEVYYFSNYYNDTENYDVGKNLILESDDIKNEDGKIVKEVYSNVYVWDDLKIKYYPISTLNSKYYLTFSDMIFNKKSPNIPRMIKIPQREGIEAKAPVGNYKYRFVWDYGDGVYSAPSAEIIVPDMIYSAVKDEDINYNYNNETINVRRGIYEHEHLKNISTNEPHLIYSFGDIQKFKIPSLFDNQLRLTKVGELLFKVKQKIYGFQNHKYGVQDAKSIDDINNWDIIRKGEFGTIITLDCEGIEHYELEGFIAEGIAVSGQLHGIEQSWGGAWNDDFPGFASYRDDVTGEYFFSNFLKLAVQLFPVLTPEKILSVFDSKGRLRPAYSKTLYPSINLKDLRIMIFPGYSGLKRSDIQYLWQAHHLGRLFTSDWLFSPRSRKNPCQNIVWFGIITPPEDENNHPEKYYLNEKLENIRPNTMIRGAKTADESLKYLVKIEDNEAISRLLLSGTMTINLLKKDMPFFLMDRDKEENWQKEDNITIDFRYYPVSNIDPAWVLNRYNVSTSYLIFKNVEIDIHFNATRFIGLEQLLSYFPSSLLFESPRVAIKIPNEKIPKRAKRLLIFRTKSALANDWVPNDYGLIKEIEIRRNSNGDAETELIDGSLYNGIYFFDSVKDNEIDFGTTPLQYEGLRFPLKSRFNIPLMERVYYLNFEETYQPMKPRDDLNNTWKYEIVDDEEGYKEDTYLRYKIVYRDNNNIVSRESETEEFLVGSNKSVLFYLMPAGYDDSIKYLEIYRRKDKNTNNNTKFYKIGEVVQEDLGIFLDNDLKEGAELLSTEPDVQVYESGMRWSEPYRPDWIKADSFVEYRSGDGSQITGVENNYGNLLIFKETSMHRVAVQGDDPPISRTDEITPEIGLIAPNAIVNVDNTLYFLSRKGFMVYDNNIIKKIDLPFTEELHFVLTNTDDYWIREASCGYNPKYQEIYLNIAGIQTPYRYIGYGANPLKTEYQLEYGEAKFHGYYRKLYGHIYILSLDKSYVTKFGYVPTIDYITHDGRYLHPRLVEKPYQLIRKYYTNSLGELRSADILPIAYLAEHRKTRRYYRGFYWAGIYIETPYQQTTIKDIYYKDKDDILDWRIFYNLNIPYDNIVNMNSDEININDEIYAQLNLRQIEFPKVFEAPFKNIYCSKFYTGDTETLIKRIRNVIINIYSKDKIIVRGICIPYYAIDERIDNQNFSPIEEMFIFNPTEQSIEPITNMVYQGTNKNIISFVPKVHNVYITDEQGEINTVLDWYGKAIRYSVEIETKQRTQLNNLVIHLRPIHPYIM